MRRASNTSFTSTILERASNRGRGLLRMNSVVNNVFSPSYYICLFSLIVFLSYYNLKRLHVRVKPISTIRIHRRDTELFPMVLAEVVVYLIRTLPHPIIKEMATTNYMMIEKSIECIEMENLFVTVLF